jgi:COMPASS component SPP1
MEYMRKRIDNWVVNGGNRAHLWESVKGAPRREGTVAVVPPASDEDPRPSYTSPQGPDQAPGNYRSSDVARAIVQPAQNRIEREINRLRAQLGGWTSRKTGLQHELGIIDWRLRLLARANERADIVGQCGWDQRLCYGDEECVEFGAGVLESYDMHAEGDEAQVEEFGVWWCAESRKCPRHAGYGLCPFY